MKPQKSIIRGVKMPSASEDQIQAAIVQWLTLAGFLVAHIPNEGRRSVQEGMRQRRLGLAKGAPDLVVALPEGRTLWIEVKSATGRLSEAQTGFAAGLHLYGHDWLLARSVDDVAAFFRGRAA